jgi:hypothetical protein
MKKESQKKNHKWKQGRMQDFGQRGSIIGFSSLSELNSLTNRVLNKNIKIISLYIKIIKNKS